MTKRKIIKKKSSDKRITIINTINNNSGRGKNKGGKSKKKLQPMDNERRVPETIRPSVLFQPAENHHFADNLLYNNLIRENQDQGMLYKNLLKNVDEHSHLLTNISQDIQQGGKIIKQLMISNEPSNEPSKKHVSHIKLPPTPQIKQQPPPQQPPQKSVYKITNKNLLVKVRELGGDDKKFKKATKIQLEEEVKRLNDQKLKQMQINLSSGGLNLSTPQKEENLYDNYLQQSQFKEDNPYKNMPHSPALYEKEYY